MVYPSLVPQHVPITTPAMLASLRRGEGLEEQRAMAHSILMACQDMRQNFQKDGQHESLTPEIVPWALERTDHTTLFQNDSETRSWMLRLAEETTGPYPQKALCARIKKLGPVIEFYQNHPDIGIAAVTGFPRGSRAPGSARREIEQFANLVRDLPNPKYLDSVAHYHAWMQGEHALVEDIFAAESEACKEFGLTWKPIMKVSVHAYQKGNAIYGPDCFRSIYDITRLACRYGGNPKTSTGQAAMPPYNEFVPKDVGHIALALPMMIATRDHNVEHGTLLWNKFSGGQESALDVAMFKIAAERVYADVPDMVDAMVFGANYQLRKNLLRFEAQANRDNPNYDPTPAHAYGVERNALPAHLTGLGIIGPEIVSQGLGAALQHTVFEYGPNQG